MIIKKLLSFSIAAISAAVLVAPAAQPVSSEFGITSYAAEMSSDYAGYYITKGVKDWLKVRRADTLAQSDYMREEKLAELELLAKLGDEIKEEMCCLKTADLAINGHDMIAMGFSGADIKNALNTALEAVIDEEIENERETLLTFIRGKFYGQ